MKKKFMTKDRKMLCVFFGSILVLDLTVMLVIRQAGIEVPEQAGKALKYGFRLLQVALFFWYGYKTVLKELWIWIFAFMTVAAPYLNVIAFGVLLFQKMKTDKPSAPAEVGAA